MNDAGAARPGDDGRARERRAAAIAADVRRGALAPDEGGRRLAALYRAGPASEPAPSRVRSAARLTLMVVLYLAAVVVLFTAVVHGP